MEDEGRRKQREDKSRWKQLEDKSRWKQRKEDWSRLLLALVDVSNVAVAGEIITNFLPIASTSELSQSCLISL